MKEEFKKSLNDFLEEKTYIMAYRSNYDSAREFNKELINYIKQLETNWKELKKYIENVENVNMILGYKVFYQNELILKMQEIESGKNE